MTAALRLLSVDARSSGRDRHGLSRTISAAGCDLVCVHGGPHLLRWRSISAALARRAGLVVVTGGRTAGANLLLSTLSVDVLAVRDVRFVAGSPLGLTGAAVAALRARGADFVLVSANLAGNAAQQLEQVRQLQDAVGTLVPGDPPVVLSVAGADPPGSPAWQSLVERGQAVADRLVVDGRIVAGQAIEHDRGIRVDLSLEGR